MVQSALLVNSPEQADENKVAYTVSYGLLLHVNSSDSTQEISFAPTHNHSNSILCSLVYLTLIKSAT